MVNLKWNAEINRYRNISFQWQNQNGHRTVLLQMQLQEYGHYKNMVIGHLCQAPTYSSVG